MAGPPNSVAIASPIPTEYFGNAFGKLAAAQPSAYQFSGHVQPVIPQIKASTVGFPDLRTGVQPIPTRPATLPSGRRLRDFIDRFDYTNPLSWWQRQLDGLDLPSKLPTIPSFRRGY